MKDLDIGEVLTGLVNQHLSAGFPPLDPPADSDGDPLCSMVRACIAAGDPWASAIKTLVMSLYDKMRRES